jgi:hypothetical protein
MENEHENREAYFFYPVNFTPGDSLRPTSNDYPDR